MDGLIIKILPKFCSRQLQNFKTFACWDVFHDFFGVIVVCLLLSFGKFFDIVEACLDPDHSQHILSADDKRSDVTG